MKANKNKMTDEQRKIYDFIESNVYPDHRVEATLFMGHLAYIRNQCKEHITKRCYGCPFYDEHEKYYESCMIKQDHADEWNIEKMTKNIFSNLN